jgi:hypothetical protein
MFGQINDIGQARVEARRDTTMRLASRPDWPYYIVARGASMEMPAMTQAA